MGQFQVAEYRSGRVFGEAYLKMLDRRDYLELGKENWLRLLMLVAGVLAFSGFLLWLLLFLERHVGDLFPRLAPYAYFLVFFTTLLSSAMVVLPAPGSLFALSIALAVAAKGNPFWVVLAASSGSTLGEISSYLVGAWGRKSIVKKDPEKYTRVEKWVRRYGLLGIFFLALVPSVFFFDLAGIAAGALRVPMWQFLLACWAGRFPRSMVEIYTGGEIFRFFISLFR